MARVANLSWQRVREVTTEASTSSSSQHSSTVVLSGSVSIRTFLRMRHLHPHQVVVHAQRQSLYAEAVDWNWRVLSLGDGLEDVDTARLEGREYDGLDARGSLGKGSKVSHGHSHMGMGASTGGPWRAS